MITKAQAESLPRGTILHHTTIQNADLSSLHARINGKCKTWKTRPDEFRLPVKYGLKTCFYITDTNADEWSATRP